MPDQAADQALFPPVIFSLHAGAVYVQAYYNVWFTATLAFSILLLRPCFTIRESPPMIPFPPITVPARTRGPHC